ncbi:unnamed protein product, partial [Symbiodinium microadriaticum]
MMPEGDLDADTVEVPEELPLGGIVASQASLLPSRKCQHGTSRNANTRFASGSNSAKWIIRLKSDIKTAQDNRSRLRGSDVAVKRTCQELTNLINRLKDQLRVAGAGSWLLQSRSLEVADRMRLQVPALETCRTPQDTTAAATDAVRPGQSECWVDGGSMEILQEAFLKRREVSNLSESKEDFITSFRKLSHDCEMLAYLEELGHLQPPHSPFCRALRAASAKSYAGRPTQAFVVRIPEGDPRRGRFQQLSRALYVPSVTTMPGPAVAPHLRGADLDAHGQAVLDEVLSSQALEALSRQLRESSMYFHREETGTYLVALWEDGLASPLLWQIAMELIEALPALADHVLCEAKAYKALSGGATSPGLEAQGADVALLLWALPTDLWPTQSPAMSLPVAGSFRPIHYASNRAVLWRDDCAETGPQWIGADP